MTAFPAPDLNLWIAVYHGEIGMGLTPDEARAEAQRVAERKARAAQPADEQAHKLSLAREWAGANLKR